MIRIRLNTKIGLGLKVNDGRVIHIDPQGLAAEAGIFVDDEAFVIRQLNKERIEQLNTGDSLQRALGIHYNNINVEIRRPASAKFVVPNLPVSEFVLPSFGTPVDNRSKFSHPDPYLGFEYSQDNSVTKVEKDGPATNLGIQVGDKVDTVGGVQSKRVGEHVLLTAQIDGKRKEISLRILTKDKRYEGTSLCYKN